MGAQKLSEKFDLDVDLSVDDVVGKLAAASGWSDDQVLRKVPQLDNYRARLSRLRFKVFNDPNCILIFGYASDEPESFLQIHLYFDVETGFRVGSANLT
ncbi:MAG: hypothetical protein O3B47_01855 [bacterium]|nr:hypothetical protein [bacterium]